MKGRLKLLSVVAAIVFFLVCPQTSLAVRDGGYDITLNLWAKAVLQVSGAPVTLVWKVVGTDITPSGDQVISGYFYADREVFAYGSQFNPELFVKIYIAKSGWCNIAFNHVTVDNVTVYSAHHYAGAAQQTGTATLTSRLAQHQYNGVAIENTSPAEGVLAPLSTDSGYIMTSGLWAKAVLQPAGGPVTLVWKEVGSDTTLSGDKVVSGYFYADPADFAYGSEFNPEVFVKIYIAKSGWCNIAFNHVTVDNVSISSAYNYSGTPNQTGTATINNRLIEHPYTGVVTSQNLTLIKYVSLSGTHSQVAFHPDNARVTTNSRQGVEQAVPGTYLYFFPTYNAETGDLVRTGSSPNEVTQLYMAAGGTALYTYGFNWDTNVRDYEFRKYDLSSGQYISAQKALGFNRAVLGDGTHLSYAGQSSNPLSPDGSVYYSFQYDSATSTYSVVSKTINTDGSIGSQIASISAPLPRPVSLTVSPDGKKIFILNDDFTGSGISVAIITTSPFQFVKSVALSGGAFPVGVAVGADGTAYLAWTSSFYVNGENNSTATIDAIDPASYELKTVSKMYASSGINDVPSQYYGLAVSPDGKLLAAVGFGTTNAYGLWLFRTNR